MADEAPEHLMREANEWDEVESPVVVQARRRVRALDLDQDSEDENEGTHPAGGQHDEEEAEVPARPEQPAATGQGEAVGGLAMGDLNISPEVAAAMAAALQREGRIVVDPRTGNVTLLGA
jgi:hypothetical protein